eukprot:scaffold3735_cov153-Pinguiococcus_pyrenoidosus.AAC.1
MMETPMPQMIFDEEVIAPSRESAAPQRRSSSPISIPKIWYRSKSDVLEEVTAVVRDSVAEVDMIGGLPLWNVFCTRRGRELYGQTKAALIREATRWECEITGSVTKDILVYKILSASGGAFECAGLLEIVGLERPWHLSEGTVFKTGMAEPVIAPSNRVANHPIFHEGSARIF